MSPIPAPSNPNALNQSPNRHSSKKLDGFDHNCSPAEGGGGDVQVERCLESRLELQRYAEQAHPHKPPRQRKNRAAPSRAKKINTLPVHNRIFAVMMHTTRYAFKSRARLAADCGVCPSTVCRLLTGECSPSFALIVRITQRLEQQLGKRIDPRELVSLDGHYPTAAVCEVAGCKGCLPDEAYDEQERLRPEYRDIQPGHWSGLSTEFVQKALSDESLDEEARNAATRKDEKEHKLPGAAGKEAQ